MAEKLKKYNEKRDFESTAEPVGKSAEKKAGKKLVFVVQHHLARRDHYDFRLEWDGALLSWAVPKGPSYNPADKRLAVRVEDHPYDYKDFEGTIPKGEYGGGTVMLWDEGYWEPTHSGVKEGLEKGTLKFILDGKRLKGGWTLVRLKPKEGKDEENWLLIKEHDEFIKDEDGISNYTTSVRTGRTMGEIEKVEAEREIENSASRLERLKELSYSGKGLEKKVKTAGGKLSVDGINISNPDKLIFENPDVTKGEVVKYYAAVAERMAPYAGDRILSIVRCPKGISSSCFFKKHPVGADNKGIVTMPVENSDGEKEDYFYIENALGIISEAQMDTLEFHVWGSRVQTLERPDMMVFDLDPDVGLDVGKVRQGVRDLKGLLDELNLVSFLKTSGGKGYHVVVPFIPSAEWDIFHDFSKRVAEVMEKKWPDRYSSNMRKVVRKDKIFIDWVRNGRGATSVAPYSLRARPGASVSMPITWKELDTVAPDGIKMKDALERIKEPDPWEEFYKIEQRLK
jgi:DNA ligase D, 3''-phosphoesterase domain/DNA polymerase LigD, polymerase domain